MKTKKRNYQFIFWFPVWQGFHFYRMTYKNRWSLIYEWFLYLGFWELRKIQDNKEEALKNYRKWRDYDYNKNKI